MAGWSQGPELHKPGLDPASGAPPGTYFSNPTSLGYLHLQNGDSDDNSVYFPGLWQSDMSREDTLMSLVHSTQ